MPLESTTKVIRNCWVYKIKRFPNKTIERNKSRVVSLGFHQVEGVDYFETVSLLVKHTIVRVVLSLVLSKDWVVRHLDVNNVFLNSDLEMVYMTQPRGFEVTLEVPMVCKLKKAIYGLKQALRD